MVIDVTRIWSGTFSVVIDVPRIWQFKVSRSDFDVLSCKVA